MAVAFAQASRDCAAACRFPSNNMVIIPRHCPWHSAPVQRAAVPPCVAAGAEAGWGQKWLASGRLTACSCSSSTSRAAQAPTSAHNRQTLQLQQRPILIALGTTSDAAAKAVVLQLQTFGSSEVWATSAANHFTAVQALAEAHMQLAEKQQSLAATASLSASDQEVRDDQKRRLKKLTLQLQLCGTPLDPAVWTAGAANHISANRTKSVAELVQAMREQLEQQSISSERAVVLEARGEQAVTRALKAFLSLQSSQQGALLLRPWRGEVVDIVAEKRGEERLAGGLLLHASWGQQDQLKAQAA